jgi:hypothetical protein
MRMKKKITYDKNTRRSIGRGGFSNDSYGSTLESNTVSATDCADTAANFRASIQYGIPVETLSDPASPHSGCTMGI